MSTFFKRFSSILLLTALPLAPALAANPIGKLYTMSNAVSGNEVLVYNRLSDGSLSKAANIPTNGTGSGGGLGNQGALTFSKDGFFLLGQSGHHEVISCFNHPGSIPSSKPIRHNKSFKSPLLAK